MKFFSLNKRKGQAMRTDPSKAASVRRLGLRRSNLHNLLTLSLLLTSMVIEPAGPAAVLQGVLDQGFLDLNWDAPDAKLEEAPALNGPWQTVITTNSLYRLHPSNNLTNCCRFYRLEQPAPGKKWLTVAAATMTSTTNKESNLQTFYSSMEQAASNGVDLIVFPEVALQGCPGWRQDNTRPSPQDLAYVQQTAETVPGPSISNLVARANALNMFVIFGMTEKDAASTNLYNAEVFLGPGGVLGTHRKSMSFGNDAWFWAQGTNLIEVFDSPIGKVGMIICGEMGGEDGTEATAVAPRLAAAGADLLVTVTAWWTSTANLYELGTTKSASVANRWHVAANQVGRIGYSQCYGHSRIIDPLGRITCDSGTAKGLIIWPTDILTDAVPH
jgi:predicted amidohydrolase